MHLIISAKAATSGRRIKKCGDLLSQLRDIRDWPETFRRSPVLEESQPRRESGPRHKAIVRKTRRSSVPLSYR